MKIPQFQVRTLFLLTAIMGVLFVACAAWPVTEVLPASGNVTISINPPGQAPAGIAYTIETTATRPPTFAEWAVRAGIAVGLLIAAFVIVGAWRARRARATPRLPTPRMGANNGSP